MADLSASIAIQLDGSAAIRDAKQLDAALDSLRNTAQSVSRAMRQALDVSTPLREARDQVSALDSSLRTFQNTLNGVERRAHRAAAAVGAIGGNFQTPIDNLHRFQRALEGIERRAQRTASSLSSMGASAAQSPNIAAAASAGNTTAATNAQNALQGASQQATGAISHLANAISDLAHRANTASQQIARAASQIHQRPSGASAGGGSAGMSASSASSGPSIPTSVPGMSSANSGMGSAQGLLSNLRQAANDVAGAFSQLQGSVGSLAGALQTLAGGMVLKSIADAGMQLQTLQMTLKAVTGSTQEADAAYQTLMQQSDRLGLKVADLSDGMVQFIAASKGAGVSAKDATAIFFNVAEGMAAIGTPAEKAKNAMFALQQMMSKPFASSEEITQQLAEAVPGAPAMIAAGLGLKDTATLMKMVEDRAISGRDAVMAFASEITKQFPATEESVNRAQSQFNRLSNEISTLKETVANAGFLDALANAAIKLREALGTEEAKAMAVELGQNLGAAVDKAAAAIGFLHDNLDTVKIAIEALIALKVAGWATNIAGAFGGLAATLARHPLLTIGTVAIGAGTAFAALVNETGSIGAAFDELGARTGAASQKLLDTIGASDSVKAKFAEIGAAADAAKPAVVSFLESFTSDFMAGINRDIEAFGRALEDMTGLFGDVSGRFQNVVTTLSGYFDALTTKANETSERAGMPDLSFDAVLGASGRAFPALLDAFRALDGDMQDFVVSVNSGLSSIPGAFQEAGAQLRSSFDDAVSAVTRRWEEFRNAIGSGVDHIRQRVSEVGQALLDSVNFDAIQRSIDGFRNGVERAVEAVRAAGNAVAGFFAPALKALDSFSSKAQSVWNFFKGNAPAVPAAPKVEPPKPKPAFPEFPEDAPLTGGQGSGELHGGAQGDVFESGPVPARKPAPPPSSQRVAGALALPNLPRTSPTGGGSETKATKAAKTKEDNRFGEQLSELQAQARELQGISAAYDQGSAAVEKFRQQQELLIDVQQLSRDFKPKQVEALRTELEKIQNLKIDIDFRQGMAEIDDRIRTTKQLSDAQAEGGDAVREAQASIEAYNQAVRMGVASDEARVASLKEKHKALLDVQAAAAVDEQIRGLNLQAEDTGRLSSAVRSGSVYAVQDAEIENATLAIARQQGVENNPAQMERIRAAQRTVFEQDQTLQGESRIRDMEIELEMVNRLAAAENLSGAAREGAIARIQAEAELKRQNIDVTTELSQRELELAEALGRANAKTEEFNDALSQLARSGGNGMQALRDATASSLGHLEDALVGIVTGTMSAKEAFRNMAASIAADLARIAIRQMIIAPIAGMMGGMMGGPMMMPMMATGGIVGPGGEVPVRRFATGGRMKVPGFGNVPMKPTGVGGIARQPTASLFGEGSDDEAYVPLKAGEIPIRPLSNGDFAVELPGGRSIPAEIQAFAEGGVMSNLPEADMPAMDNKAMPAMTNQATETTNIAPNITVNVQMPAGGGSQEEGQRFGQAIARQLESQVLDIMRKQLRPGGLHNPQGF